MYTAGAIVTVTVTLTRKDMKHLFGDETVKEQTIIDEAKVEVVKEKEPSDEQNQTVKRPAWLKQQKGQKKSHNKKGSNKKVPTAKIVAQAPSENHTSHQNSTPNERKKNENKVLKEKSSDVSDSEADSERSDDEESTQEKKDSTIDDDDIEWERYIFNLNKYFFFKT